MAYNYQEYPRTLHKAGGETHTVRDDAAKAAALADGWSLTPIVDPDPAPTGAEAPKRRGRPPKDRP